MARIKPITFYPSEEVRQWYDTLPTSAGSSTINDILSAALRSGSGSSEPAGDPIVMRRVAALEFKVAIIERFLKSSGMEAAAPPLKIAELIFSRPRRLMMGLQVFELSADTLKFMAHRHLNEDIELRAWSDRMAKVEGTLLTEDKLIEFTGTVYRGTTVQNKEGRVYPVGVVGDLRITHERTEPHDFSDENDLAEWLEWEQKLAMGTERHA